ncbi:MAG: bifunctional DNA primase/polymerase [Desulfamplus sp.]|nr:bifunctional DNA primase/polymerase [Desulfamplus sp.]
MSNTIFNAALEYSEQGYSIIPVDRSTKKPCIPWKEYQNRIATEEEIEDWWEKYPDANVAIITGKKSGLAVVDADSKDGMAWMSQHCTKTTVYAKTGKGCHAYYLYPYHTDIKNAVRIAPDVDVRGEGGYVVAPPSIHANGTKYEWVITGDGFDDMPEFQPVNGFKSLFTTEDQPKGGNLNVNLTGVKASTNNSTNDGVEKGSRNNTLAQKAGKWAKLGLEFDEVEVLAKKWNSTNTPPLGESELKATLKSIWKRHIEHDAPTIEIPEETPHLIPLSSTTDKAFPEHLLHPGGLLEDLMQYIEENSAVSVPVFSLAGSLSFMGAVMGQKVMTQTGLRTNLYCISLGDSGSGKNGAIDTLPQLLRRTSAMDVQGPTELTSETAILSWIAKENKRNCWFCLDEIGQVIKGMQNAASPQSGIPRQLTSLFSATDRPVSKGYAISANNIFVPWHHVSLYGTTTKGRFWEGISGSEVADGFVARILVFQSTGESPFPKSKKRFDIPKDIIDRVSDIFNIPIEIDKSHGNMPNLNVPIPNIIPFTEDADKIMDAFARHYHSLKNRAKEDESGRSSIYGRTAEHAAKISLIHAVSLAGANVKEIGVASVQYACQLMEYLTQFLIAETQNNIAETEVASWKHKIIKAVRDVMAKNRLRNVSTVGASLRDLQRGRCQGLKSKELQELLNDLVVAEKLGKTIQVLTGKSVARYFVV